jgi:hypothetical protein
MIANLIQPDVKWIAAQWQTFFWRTLVHSILVLLALLFLGKHSPHPSSTVYQTYRAPAPQVAKAAREVFKLPTIGPITYGNMFCTSTSGMLHPRRFNRREGTTTLQDSAPVIARPSRIGEREGRADLQQPLLPSSIACDAVIEDTVTISPPAVESRARRTEQKHDGAKKSFCVAKRPTARSTRISPVRRTALAREAGILPGKN